VYWPPSKLQSLAWTQGDDVSGLGQKNRGARVVPTRKRIRIIRQGTVALNPPSGPILLDHLNAIRRFIIGHFFFSHELRQLYVAPNYHEFESNISENSCNSWQKIQHLLVTRKMSGSEHACSLTENFQVKDLTSNVTFAARWISNLSLLAVIFACLVLWGSIALLFTPPSYSPDPAVQWEIRYEENSQVRRLPDLSPFWLPIGLGLIMCGMGFVTLVQTARERE
jgi:hypothetical protein